MPRAQDLPQAFFLSSADLIVISRLNQSLKIPGQLVSPSWGPTPAEQSVGVFNPVTSYLENDVRRYGAVGQGEDNTSHINTALAVAAANGRPPCFSGLNLFTQGNHTRDVSLCGVEGDGALITCTTINPVWTDFASGSGTANNVEHSRHPMRDLMFRGQFNNTGIGLLISDSAEPSSSFLDYYSVSAEGFQTACQIGSNAYILKFFGGSFARSTTGFLLPQAITNAAEQVTFSGTRFTDNSAFGIDNQNGNSELKLDNCHVDGNNLTYYRGDHGSRTYMNGCHVEILNAANQSVDPVQVLGTNCYLNMDGGSFLCDATSMPALSAFNIAANATVRITGGKLLNQLRNTANNGAGVLARGAGRMIIDPGANTTYNSAQLPIIVGVEDNFNLLSDGQFLQGTIQDNIAIVSDGAAITSRTVGQNLSIAIGTNGAQQCLAITKSAGISAAAGVGVIVPCQPGQRMSAQGQYACSLTTANNLFLYGAFAILAYGANGVPFFIKFSLQTGANITNVSPAFTYFNTGGQFIAPNWATHFLLNCNLNGLAASTFYLDNLVVSAM